MHVYAFVHGYIDIRIFILYDTHRVPIADAICRHRCRRKRNRLAYSVPQSVRRDRQIAPVARFFYYLFISLLFFLQNTKAGTLILPSEESWKTGCCFFAGMFHVTLRTVCVSSALRITTQQGPGNGRVERRVPLQQVTTTRGQFSVVGLVSLFTLLIYWIVLRFVSP